MNTTRRVRRLPLLAGAAVAVALAGLAGCAPKPAPPVAQKPAPPPVVIPPMPRPPMNAPVDMPVPPLDAAGVRHTVNYGISTSQAVWNLRSAYNVAALTCPEVQYAPILDGYKRFLKVYSRSLDKANREIDSSFRSRHSGRAATVARESYQTQVYNFFSLPPVDSAFCKAAMEVSTELQTVEPSQFDAYSFVGLAKMEAPFKEFFAVYEQYRADLAAWQARYGGNGQIIVRPDGTYGPSLPAGPSVQPSISGAPSVSAPPTVPPQAVAAPQSQTGYTR